MNENKDLAEAWRVNIRTVKRWRSLGMDIIYPPEPLYTIDEVAQWLKVTRRTIQRKLAAGDIIPYGCGGVVRIGSGELNRLREEKQEG